MDAAISSDDVVVGDGACGRKIVGNDRSVVGNCAGNASITRQRAGGLNRDAVGGSQRCSIAEVECRQSAAATDSQTADGGIGRWAGDGQAGRRIDKYIVDVRRIEAKSPAGSGVSRTAECRPPVQIGSPAADDLITIIQRRRVGNLAMLIERVSDRYIHAGDDAASQRIPFSNDLKKVDSVAGKDSAVVA